jgi:hypothetical protein
MPPAPKDEQPTEPQPPELESEQIVDLPAREALSIVDPGIFGLRVPVPIARSVDDAPSTLESVEADETSA